MLHQRSPSSAAQAGHRQQRPAALLVIRTPSGDSGRSVPVDPHGTVIGRAPSSDLVLNHPGVSRRHAAVLVRAGQYVVEDLGSLNGTLLNGRLVTAAHRLLDGDKLKFGGVVVEFRLTEPGTVPAQPWPVDGSGWQPDEPTKPIEAGRRGGAHSESHSLRAELRAAPDFSSTALLLAVLGSVVGAVLLGELEKNIFDGRNWGPLAGAALGPVISTTFTTKLAGEKGRIRSAIIVLLSGGALFITVNGFSVLDAVTGRPVLSAATDRTSSLPLPGVGNFIPESGTGEETPGNGPTQFPQPATFSVSPSSLDCGEVLIDHDSPCLSVASITNAGPGRLTITSLVSTGPQADDFAVEDEDCTTEPLDAGDSCEIQVRFGPTDSGERVAVLEIHHGAADVPAGIALSGTGTSEPGPDEDESA